MIHLIHIASKLNAACTHSWYTGSQAPVAYVQNWSLQNWTLIVRFLGLGLPVCSVYANAPSNLPNVTSNYGSHWLSLIDWGIFCQVKWQNGYSCRLSD